MLEELFDAVRKRMRGGWIIPAVAAAALWFGSGIYQVNPSEVGVVLRWGRHVESTSPGLHWHLPWPMERVFRVPVMEVKKEEIGFRTISVGPPARYRAVVEEARMLTSDGNIVDVDFIVQYRIKDPIEYLFQISNPVETLRDCAESAMREVVGRSTIDKALTEGRLEVQIGAQELLQNMLDDYNAGLLVTTVKLQDVGPPEPVQDAFKDVINAEQDKERMINEAEGFANDILPKARGVAAERLNEAEGHREAIVKDAQGAAGRFELVLEQYQAAPDITRKRMYLETMEFILPEANKIILDEGVADKVLPLLPIGSMTPEAAAAASVRGGKQ